MNKIISSKENERRHWRNMWQGYIDDMRSPDWPVWEQRIVVGIMHNRIEELERKQEWHGKDWAEAWRLLNIIFSYSLGFTSEAEEAKNGVQQIYEYFCNEKE